MSKIVEMKQRGVRAKLREAHESGALVRLWRAEHEAASFTGFVVGIGKEFFLLWALGDYIGFDGIYALRHRDVTEIEVPDKNAGFLLKAMALKDIKPAWPADFKLDDVDGAVRSGPYHQALAQVAGTPPDDIRPFSRDQGSLH